MEAFPDNPPVVFQLYVAFQKSGQLVADALEGSGVAAEDAPLYSVLARLAPLTPKELASRLGMAPSTLTYRLRALEQRGHVDRTPNPADGRSTLLRLSMEGSGVWERALPKLTGATHAAEARLAVPQRDVGIALGALAAALEEELAARRAATRTGAPGGR